MDPVSENTVLLYICNFNKVVFIAANFPLSLHHLMFFLTSAKHYERDRIWCSEKDITHIYIYIKQMIHYKLHASLKRSSGFWTK
jgi:hypothetical protein